MNLPTNTDPNAHGSSLAGKHLIVGLTGGIAAYKVCELLRRLREQGAGLSVIMTRAAGQFITPTTLQALSGGPVYTDTDQWAGEHAQASDASAMAHIDLSRRADAIIVAPASAHFLAQTAQGLASDLLTTLVLARNCPLIIAPAMNVQMWQNPATQRNVQTLQQDGVTLLGPASGDQACGEVGLGRMLEPNELLDALMAFFEPKVLQGKTVLITAGPTFEPIDPVRGITNLSSGKTGFAIARAAADAGAHVTLIAGPCALPTPYGVQRHNAKTAQQMLDAVMHHVGKIDIFISVAAVADWRAASISEQKIKKSNAAPAAINLTPNPDILATVAAMPKAPYCVGFAAESQDLERHARSKLQAKNLQLVIGNLVQDSLGADEAQWTFVSPQGTHSPPRADKRSLARSLIAHIAQQLSEPL
ncbi:MAG TPA: bifunctional phosphopantothenoylcysteine decarboxylase/phosphopantothenate--cysteine ligase CoaBC [Burkholderiaceae bacterium]|nr:bifunctional phosphopantothenoylcysteine decarboxylase/phosphopantothenate--cysteine ligase CoaBC [Burkholderiaceae bacterium]